MSKADIDRIAKVVEGWPRDDGDLKAAREVVRAVLEAVREPSEAMIQAAADPHGGVSAFLARDVWRDMIDKLLEE